MNILKVLKLDSKMSKASIEFLMKSFFSEYLQFLIIHQGWKLSDIEELISFAKDFTISRSTDQHSW